MNAHSTSPAVIRLATLSGFLALALPLAAGAGVNWAMQFTNRLFLSWYNPDSLAASLPAGLLVYMIQVVFTSSVGYVGAFAAQHVGANEPEEAGAMAWPMIWVAIAAGALGLALVPLRHVIFGVFGADAAVSANMSVLGGWYLAETLPAVLFAGWCGWFGGLGRTGLVLRLSGGVCALSILLNWWLIFGGLGVPALGMHGAGLATLLATSSGCLAAAGFFFGPQARERFGTWRQRNCDAARWWRFARTAMPRGITEALEMVSFVMFTAAVAHLGSDALAANNLVLSLYLVGVIPLMGLGQGVTIAVGQAIGSGRIDIARRITRLGILLAFSVLVPAAIVFASVPHLLILPFAAIDAADLAASAAHWARISDLAMPLMLICAMMFIGDGLQIIFRFAVQGAGDTRWPLVALTIASLGILGGPAYAISWWVPPATWQRWELSPLTGCWLVFAAYLWIIAGLMAWRYRYGPWSRMTLRHSPT